MQTDLPKTLTFSVSDTVSIGVFEVVVRFVASFIELFIEIFVERFKLTVNLLSLPPTGHLISLSNGAAFL